MKTFLRRLLLVLGGLLGLLALFHLVENWRGQRAWNQWKQARITVGDSYELALLIPPSVPEAENFAAAPRVAEFVIADAKGPCPRLPALPAIFNTPGGVGDWRKGLKADLGNESKVKELKESLLTWEGELAALAVAARRPHCRLMKNYEDADAIPALLGMRRRVRVLSLRALVALNEKREAAALEDVLTGLRVAVHLQKEPQLITQLLRNTWMNILIQPIWEGLQDHRWSGAQLQVLQEALSTVDLVDSWSRAWRFERIWGAHNLERLAETPWWSRPSVQALYDEKPAARIQSMLLNAVFPNGWVYQNLCRQDRYFVAQFQEVFDPTAHRIRARRSQAAAQALAGTKRSPYTQLFLVTMPALTGQNIRVARTQSGLDLAVIACALERHRLDKGHYPETLAALAPTYLPQAPVDVIEGQPLKYTLLARNSYRLYSMGWNLQDDAGKTITTGAEDHIVQDQGDWTWAMAR